MGEVGAEMVLLEGAVPAAPDVDPAWDCRRESPLLELPPPPPSIWDAGRCCCCCCSVSAFWSPLWYLEQLIKHIHYTAAVDQIQRN